LSFPLVGNPSEKKDSGPILDKARTRARMTEKGNPVASYRELQVKIKSYAEIIWCHIGIF
jgi:hypothetical protein